MTFYDVLCQWNKETEIVIKCRKLSWRLSQIVVTFFSRPLPAVPFWISPNKHKEFWRDTPWCVSRLSRGNVPSVPSHVPSVPRTFRPLNWNFHINRPKRPGCPWDVPNLSLGRFRGIPTTKFLYVIFFIFFFSLPIFRRKKQTRETPKKARVFLFAEPLESLEKKGQAHKKQGKSEHFKRKKARKSKEKQALEGQGAISDLQDCRGPSKFFSQALWMMPTLRNRRPRHHARLQLAPLEGSPPPDAISPRMLEPVITCSFCHLYFVKEFPHFGRKILANILAKIGKSRLKSANLGQKPAKTWPKVDLNSTKNRRSLS